MIAVSVTRRSLYIITTLSVIHVISQLKVYSLCSFSVIKIQIFEDVPVFTSQQSCMGNMIFAI